MVEAQFLVVEAEQDPAKALRSTYIRSDDYLLRPGQFKYIPFEPIHAETRFVAVIADYRGHENASWRQVLRIPPRGRQIMLSVLVNVLRSLPFIILLIVMLPVTVLLVGTSLGVAGAIPPLVVGATPFFARLVETALREVDRGIIEATQAMGASTRQIVFNALLPEALPGIFAAVTVTAITLVSYTAMSGLIGGGGLGDLAVRYGYQRYQPDVMAVTVILLLVLVQILQSVGDRLVVHFSRK